MVLLPTTLSHGDQGRRKWGGWCGGRHISLKSGVAGVWFRHTNFGGHWQKFSQILIKIFTNFNLRPLPPWRNFSRTKNTVRPSSPRIIDKFEFIATPVLNCFRRRWLHLLSHHGHLYYGFFFAQRHSACRNCSVSITLQPVICSFDGRRQTQSRFLYHLKPRS